MINWAAIGAIVSLFGILATVVSVSFWSGRLSEKMQVTVDTVAEHGAVQERHGILLSEQAMKIDRLEQWRNGFNAAANVSGSPRVAENG